MSIEEELWNIFTYYTLHGNQKDPSRLNRSGMFKICREIMVLDPTMTEKAISQADIDLIFTAEMKSPHKKPHSLQNDKSDRLDYDEFLSCMIRVAEKCYPSSPSPESSFQQLLMDNLLPLASRRKPIDVTPFLTSPATQSIHQYYEDALHELFRYFATASDHNTKVRNMMRSTSSHAKTFDDHKDLIIEAREVSKKQHAVAHLMSYSDFFRFASEFGLASMGLTTLDLGDIYLSVIAMRNFEPYLRKIDFREFWEALLRCALHAFRDVDINTEEKVKGMFLYIWRYIQSSVQEEISGIGTVTKGGFNTYKGGLLRGSQVLNERFIAQWTKDGYKDYLDPQSTAPTAAKALAAANKAKFTSSINSLMESALSLSDSAPPAPSETGHDPSLPPPPGSIDPATGRPRPAVILEMGRQGDHGSLGDDRIKPAQLRQLLLSRPDIAQLLLECLEDEGLGEVSSDDD